MAKRIGSSEVTAKSATAASKSTLALNPASGEVSTTPDALSDIGWAASATGIVDATETSKTCSVKLPEVWTVALTSFAGPARVAAISAKTSKPP